MRPVPRGLLSLDALRQKAAPLLHPGMRFARPPAKVYGAIGDLEVRLGRTRGDLRRAQRLRYEVFYEEMSARPSFIAEMRRRDEDRFDALCDHLLVVDTRRPLAGPEAWKHALHPKVVGTYRVLRQDVARRAHGFYTQGEYDIAPVIASMPGRNFIELGRSCVLKPYRTKRTVELLWHGLWTYVREHKGDVMIGCASFPGADPRQHAMALSYLHHFALAPPEWRAAAHDRNRTAMNIVPKDAIDVKAALKAMPPLVKAYLRIGACVGDGAVVDTQFGTTDVLIVLPIERMEPRYFSHFGAPDEVRSRVALDA